MEATLQRLYKDSVQQTGKLTSESFYADTIERPDLNNAPDISSIPAGVYIVEWTYSPAHESWRYQIMNVPNRTGIRIDIANFSSQLEGCVGVGKGYLPADSQGRIELLNSKETWNELNAYFNRQTFTLTIIDVAPPSQA